MFRQFTAYILTIGLLAGCMTTEIVEVPYDPRLEVVAELDLPSGNMIVAPDGRIFLSFHQFYAPDMRVAELMPDGSLAPYPNEAWSLGGRQADGTGFSAVLGLTVGQEGRVWFLDNGNFGQDTPLLLGWDIYSCTQHKLIHIPETAYGEGSFLNDLVVDQQRPRAYIADTAGAITVIDLETGDGWRALLGHRSVMHEGVELVVRGAVMRDENQQPRMINVNPIALSHDNQYVYYGPMMGTKVWRVPTALLAQKQIDPARLAAAVEYVGPKPPSDGSTMDAGGNFYVTDVGGNAVGALRSNGVYETLIVDERLEWPDSFGYGPDGYIYTNTNQLNRTPALNGGIDAGASPPYYIFRFKAIADPE